MSYFKFNYVNPSELEPKKVELTPGDASFKISAVFDKKKPIQMPDGRIFAAPLTTVDGTPKLTLSLSCIDSTGAQGIVYDDLTARTAWKIKTLLDAIDLPHLYDASGTLNPNDIVGYVGKCIIELKKSAGYPDRISVKKYIKASKSVSVIKKDYSDELPDDDIPF